jgi:hypothetical protein
MHPYFTAIDTADATVQTALSLAAAQTPVPALIESQLQRVLAAPVSKKAVHTGGDPFAFPYGTAKENKHFVPVLFWTAYLNAHREAQEGVDYLDFAPRTFQEFYENTSVEKREGAHVLSLTAWVLGTLVRELRLRKPDESWMKSKEVQYELQYETAEDLDYRSRLTVTYHRTDTLRYFVNVYLYTVSLAMAAANKAVSR